MTELFERYGLKPEESLTKGAATISAFEIKEINPLQNLRLAMEGGSMFRITSGKFIRLHVNGELMMSDTRMERISNRYFIEKANGLVLIAGLGIGMILDAIKSKIENGNITKVIIVEKYKDVIDLVKPKFKDFKENQVEYIHQDIFDYKPEKGVLFDTIYFDIWPEISEENLDEISTLHNRFKFKLNRKNPNSFMDSWMKDYLKRQRRRSRNYIW